MNKKIRVIVLVGAFIVLESAALINYAVYKDSSFVTNLLVLSGLIALALSIKELSHFWEKHAISQKGREYRQTVEGNYQTMKQVTPVPAWLRTKEQELYERYKQELNRFEEAEQQVKEHLGNDHLSLAQTAMKTKVAPVYHRLVALTDERRELHRKVWIYHEETEKMLIKHLEQLDAFLDQIGQYVHIGILTSIDLAPLKSQKHETQTWLERIRSGEEEGVYRSAYQFVTESKSKTRESWDEKIAKVTWHKKINSLVPIYLKKIERQVNRRDAIAIMLTFLCDHCPPIIWETLQEDYKQATKKLQNASRELHLAHRYNNTAPHGLGLARSYFRKAINLYQSGEEVYDTIGKHAFQQRKAMSQIDVLYKEAEKRLDLFAKQLQNKEFKQVVETAIRKARDKLRIARSEQGKTDYIKQRTAIQESNAILDAAQKKLEQAVATTEKRRLLGYGSAMAFWLGQE